MRLSYFVTLTLLSKKKTLLKLARVLQVKKNKIRKGNFNQTTKPPKTRKLKSVLNSTEPYSFVLPNILTTYRNLYPIRNFNIIE